jgi:hypothetical protein
MVSPMTVYRVTYQYQGEKYDAGQFDSKPEARERAYDVRQRGFTGIVITPQQHTHHKYCGH